MDNLEQKAQKYFEANPQKEKVYATSDGFLFEQKQNAAAHGKSLKETAVKTLSNTGKSSKETIPKPTEKVTETTAPTPDVSGTQKTEEKPKKKGFFGK